MSLRDASKAIKRRRRGGGGQSRGGGFGAPIRLGAVASSAAVAPSRDDRLTAEIEPLRDRHPKLFERLSRLDADQLRAVLATDPATLVRAHVGSGKTTVLVARVLYLHLVHGVPLERTAVLTFTRKAAAEIRERLEEAVGRKLRREEAAFVGTFHGVAARLLRERLPRHVTDVGPDTRIIDDDERRRLLEELVDRHGLVIRYRRRLERRLELSRQGQARFGRMTRDDDIGRLDELYEATKRHRSRLDFSDILDRAVTGLEAVDGKAEMTCGLEHVVVDELQDCDQRELRFLDALRGAAHLFAVGDPHQVIYSWRGSVPKLFDELAARHDCREYELTVNYRSTRNILGAAFSVIGAPRSCAGTREEGRRVVVRRHHDVLQETWYLAGVIGERLEAGVRASEIAILARTRAQVEALRSGLTERGVALVSIAGVSGSGPSNGLDMIARDGDEKHDDGKTTNDAEGAGVTVMTLHASKGLEFDYVFISGANEGVVPLRGAVGDEAREAEERRIFFVGMTRAREGLEIGYHGESESPTATGEPSPYLSAIPSCFVERVDRGVEAGRASARRGDDVGGDHGVAASTMSNDGGGDVDGTTNRSAPSTKFTVGASVRHPRYGIGSVVAIDEASSSMRCRFERRGEKTFSLALCPVVLVAPNAG